MGHRLDGSVFSSRRTCAGRNLDKLLVALESNCAVTAGSYAARSTPYVHVRNMVWGPRSRSAHPATSFLVRISGRTVDASAIVSFRRGHAGQRRAPHCGLFSAGSCRTGGVFVTAAFGSRCLPVGMYSPAPAADER